ncbi:hypothetical protein LSH36_45g04019 [Paralvinella palmiformis]|uniref:Ig-like domain-containing protein n=1 Tax=Paralvinella palmiformis TaxID=53620 RepID=A0AAD9NEX5_9ANNE|nr:hypothetical protein LSH36_45g04019 [Paralvinella palmiformis]
MCRLPDFMDRIVYTLIIACTCFVPLKASLPASDPHPGNKVFYHVNETQSFTCLDFPFPDSRPYVDWYLDDKQIGWNMNKVPGWSVDSVPSSHHHNTIKLRSTSRQIITATLHCMVKGDYSKNFVNIYHLIQAPKETSYDDVLARRDHPQKCPILANFTLTLTCSDALKWTNVSEWLWQKDGQTIAHSSQLEVTEPGKYTCIYKVHRSHQSSLISFTIEPEKEMSRMVPQWAFCKYASSHPEITHPEIIQQAEMTSCASSAS